MFFRKRNKNKNYMLRCTLLFHFSLSSDLPRCLISATMMLRYLYDMALDNFDKYVHEIVINIQITEYVLRKMFAPQISVDLRK